MAVVPPVEPKDASPEARAAYEESAEYFGEVLDAFKVLGHVPGSVDPVWKLHKVLMFEGGLDPHLREIAVLKINSLNEARYCGPHHAALSLGQMGIPEEKLREIHNYEGNSLYTPVEQLVLRYVEETSLTRNTSDETENALREHFNDAERVELALIVGLWNMTNRLFNTLRVDPEPFVESVHKEAMYGTFRR